LMLLHELLSVFDVRTNRIYSTLEIEPKYRLIRLAVLIFVSKLDSKVN